MPRTPLCNVNLGEGIGWQVNTIDLVDAGVCPSQLWPENHPAYQMYIPTAAAAPAGYHNSTIGHSAVHPSPALHPSGAAPLRASSTSPTGGDGGVVGLPGGGGHGHGNRMLYNDLQVSLIDCIAASMHSG